MRSDKEYKELTIKEFSKAADIYETDQAGIYEICKEDYPYIAEELRKKDYSDLLDCGCGTGPMLSLLYNEDPSRHYTGIDITPKMIEAGRAKNLEGVNWVIGDCENLPFEEDSFDVVICSNSFHHYPNPQAFFNSVKKVLRPRGRLILQDYTAPRLVLWLMNHAEMPIANLIGHGDVRAYSLDEIREFCKESGLKIEKLERAKKFRLHLVACNECVTEERDGSKTKSRDYFNTHSKSKLAHGGYWRHDYKYALSVIKKINPDSLIDIGCGPGAFLEVIQRHFPDIQLNALDLSEEMIEETRSRLSDNAIATVGDSENMPFEDEQYQVVTCNMSIHHYPHPQKAVNEMYRILKKGGYLLLNDMDCAAPIRAIANFFFPRMKAGDVKIYNKAEILEFMHNAGFGKVKYRKISPFSFQCVARK